MNGTGSSCLLKASAEILSLPETWKTSTFEWHEGFYPVMHHNFSYFWVKINGIALWSVYIMNFAQPDRSGNCAIPILWREVLSLWQSNFFQTWIVTGKRMTDNWWSSLLPFEQSILRVQTQNHPSQEWTFRIRGVAQNYFPRYLRQNFVKRTDHLRRPFELVW